MSGSAYGSAASPATTARSAPPKRDGRVVIEQFEADIHIWHHQRYPIHRPCPAPNTRDSGPCALGGPVLSRAVPRRTAPSVNRTVPPPHRQAPPMTRPIRVFRGHRQCRHRDDQARPRPSGPRTHRVALLHTGKDRPGRRRDRRVEPIGVTATGTVEQIIAAKPDVLTYHGVFPDQDLRKGTRSRDQYRDHRDWITGFHRDTNHPHPSGRKVTAVIRPACERGGSTFYGTGMNPGLTQISVSCARRMSRSSRTSRSPNRSSVLSPFGRHLGDRGRRPPRGRPEHSGMLHKYTGVFADSVYLMADGFGLELDEVTSDYELGACTGDIDLGWYHCRKVRSAQITSSTRAWSTAYPGWRPTSNGR